MIWFFERQDSRLHYEVCGRPTVLQRTTVLESRLEADGWQPPLPAPSRRRRAPRTSS